MAELANSQKFKTVTTNMGRNAVALAHVTGTSVKVTHIAVGDGSGNPIEPNAAMTELVHEVFRGTVNDVVILEDRPGQFTAELIIPQNTGGFFIREVGLFLEDGTLFAVGSTPLTEKPDLSSGAASDLIIRMIIRILDAGLIEILVDPAQVLVTRDLLERRLREHDENEESHKKLFTALKELINNIQSGIGESLANHLIAPDAHNELFNNIIALFADYVTVKTVQEITGKKHFLDNTLILKSKFIDKNVVPDNTIYNNIHWYDKNNKRLGQVSLSRGKINLDGNNVGFVSTALTAETSEIGESETSEKDAFLTLSKYDNGKKMLHTNTVPPDNDNSFSIPTTSWVQQNKTAQLVATRSTRGLFTFTGLVPGIPAYVCDKNTKEVISVILPDTDTYSLNLTEDRELEVYQ